MKTTKSFASLFVSSGLLFAATATVAFGQDPCNGLTSAFGHYDAVISFQKKTSSTGSPVGLCVGTDNTGHAVMGSTFLIPAVGGLVTRNVVTEAYGFISIGQTALTAYTWDPSGFAAALSARFSSVGGSPYGQSATGLSFRYTASSEIEKVTLLPAKSEFSAVHSTGTGQVVCTNVVVVGPGFQVCNKDGAIFVPNFSWTAPDYTLPGHTYTNYGTIVDMVGYGNGPVISTIANPNVFYVTTANNNGIANTGTFLAINVDANGNLTTVGKWDGVDVPNDGGGRVAVGNQGVSIGSGNSILLVGFHTVEQGFSIVFTSQLGPFGALAVLSANPAPLQ